MKLISILNRFELSSFKRLFQNAKAVSKYSGRSFLYCLYDMSKCIINDGIGYMEYNLFHFIDKPDDKRKTYIVFNHSQKIFKMLNEKEYIRDFDDKLKFNQIFRDYIGREYIDAAHCSDEEFEKYCKGKEAIFCKPTDSCSGMGIYKKINLKEVEDVNKLHKFMIDNDLFCEDIIVQHEEMNKLNLNSINTIRITTITKDGVAYPMYSVLRMGINNATVDNVGSGGIYTVLDENGTIKNPCWSDKTISTYTEHPTTGFKLIGFKVPMYKEAVELVKKAAVLHEHVRYVGWDIAITDKGPIIVEGNQLPGYDMPQNYFVTNSDTGLLPEFEKILGKID